MKTSTKESLLAVLLYGITITLLLCGCASLETTAYRTIGSAAVTVDTAMTGWGEVVRAGKATEAQQAKVRAAYNRYQQAMQVTHKLVDAYRTQPANKPILDQALGELTAAVLALQQVTLNPSSP